MLKRTFSIFLLVLAVAGCTKEEQVVFEAGESRPGGSSSVTASGRNAFSLPSANMKITRRLDFNVGNSFFRNPWVAAPSSTTSRDGLGPIFNTNGCQNCHIKDGRGHIPEEGDVNQVSMLVRISIPAGSNDTETLKKEGVIPHPIYGGQIQDFALPGLKAEAFARINYEYTDVELKGGEVVQLRKPLLTLDKLNYGPVPDNLMTSIRVAPPMIGLGLLEALSDSTLLANEDPDDRDGDGISGRANRVWDIEKNQTVIGRFGWKAGQPNLMQQNAGAFNGDLGVTSSLFPVENCTVTQKECLAMSGGDPEEVTDNILEKVTFYSRNLAVPVRKNAQNREVLEGKGLFAKAGCTGCHIPSLTTDNLKTHPEQSNQLIWPFTDLLLHDIGEGLADNRPEFEASGREWRTSPLWGIGKTHEVSPEATFLHDGRARTIMEAVLWHGGEAQKSRDRVVAMDKQQRALLLKFIESL